LSVVSQKYKNVEHIVVDGGSTDGTVKIIQQHEHKLGKWVSERDKGIYDAMNKGIKMAKGEVIGTLNADDYYTGSSVLKQVAEVFEKDNPDIVFGDVQFVDRKNLKKVTRVYRSNKWHPDKFQWGFMPPHPSCFIKKECFERYGYYKTDYEIASDYELLIRFLNVHQLKFKYLPLRMVAMRTGGVSTKNLRSNYILNKEIIRACRENGLETKNWMVYSKYLRKIREILPQK